MNQPTTAVGPETLAEDKIDEVKMDRMSRATQSLSSVLVSLCVHLVLLLGMALVLMGGNGQNGSGIQLLIESSQDATSDEPTHLELSSSMPEDSAEDPQPMPPELQQAAFSSQLTSLASGSSSYALESGQMVASGPSGAFAQAAAAAMAAGEGSESQAKDTGYGQGASFFGTYAPGQRFVFVIDSSQSMLEGTRWMTLRRELIRAIEGLSPDQEFFVISFDISAHPMFDRYPPQGQFLPPTQESVYQLNAWLNRIIHGGATLPASSIGLALRLKPDAIFLLSDGEIQDNTIQELRFHNRLKQGRGKTKVLVPIHTVLLHSLIGAAKLRTIADENDGVFTPVSAFP